MYPWQSIRWDGSSRMGSSYLPTWGKQHRLCVEAGATGSESIESKE
jgi:hypothetical protein